jgi:tRNA modification GTPase
MERLLRTADAGRVLREGLLAAIIGRPNVGKSSLLNALLREERAIVTDIPGTTRDSIEEIASIGGIPLRVVDTAGIRDTDDVVERIGVERARQAAAQAALVLALFDGSRPLSPEDEAIWEIAREKDHILLFTKSDLPAAFAEEEIRRRMPDSDALRLSTKTGEGMEALSQRIVAKVYGGERPGDESLFLADVREADLLRQALASLAAAREAIESGLAEDFIVIDLRAAWEKLGEIVGETVGEDIIDEIFRRVCLGK